jgi:hypothetical protein
MAGCRLAVAGCRLAGCRILAVPRPLSLGRRSRAPAAARAGCGRGALQLGNLGCAAARRATPGGPGPGPGPGELALPELLLGGAPKLWSWPTGPAAHVQQSRAHQPAGRRCCRWRAAHRGLGGLGGGGGLGGCRPQAGMQCQCRVRATHLPDSCLPCLFLSSKGAWPAAAPAALAACRCPSAAMPAACRLILAAASSALPLSRRSGAGLWPGGPVRSCCSLCPAGDPVDSMRPAGASSSCD